MFSGFSDETFEFFMAIRFNNNREFFQENHDWYLRALREPCLALAGELAPAALMLNPELETRPEKVLSRINRDIRFSKDKSPYRDYIWLAFRKPGTERSTTLGAYMDMGMEGIGCGIGFYGENKPLMNALRRRLREDADGFLSLLPDSSEYVPHIASIKRMAVPEGIPEAAKEWYRAKGFYIERTIRDFALIKSPALLDALKETYAALQPLYHYVDSLAPEDDGGEPTRESKRESAAE